MPKELRTDVPHACSMAIVGSDYEYQDIKIGTSSDGTSFMYCVITEEMYDKILFIDVSVAKAGKIYIDIQKNNKTIIIVADEVANAGSHTYQIR